MEREMERCFCSLRLLPPRLPRVVGGGPGGGGGGTIIPLAEAPPGRFRGELLPVIIRSCKRFPGDASSPSPPPPISTTIAEAALFGGGPAGGGGR